MLAKIDIIFNSLHIVVPLDAHVTEISGDSGEGKTLLFNALHYLKQIRALTFKCILINYANRVDLLTLLDPNALYVIDNADCIFQDMPELIDVVNNSKAQFLLLGRDFTGIHCNLNAYGYFTLKGSELMFQSQYPNNY